MTIKNKFRAAAVAAGLCISAASVAAPANASAVKVGVLTCDVAGGWGFVVGSSKDLHCTFVPSQGDVERYTGAVSKFGVDLGYTRGGVIIWEVIAPTTDAGRGGLQGTYAGLTASGAVGLGVGAHVLVGGLHKSISLQPVSITGESGLNLAAGIGAINLKHVH